MVLSSYACALCSDGREESLKHLFLLQACWGLFLNIQVPSPA